MRKRYLSLLLGLLMALSVSATALAYPGVDTVLSAEYDPGAAQLSYTVDDPAIDETVDVTGPEGQVNHGTIVKAFVASLREQGWVGGFGCVVRHLAHTDWGKGDQQVKPGDEPSTAEVQVLDQVTTACHRGGGTDDELEGAAVTAHPNNGKAKARGDWQPGSGPPPWAGHDGDDD